MGMLVGVAAVGSGVPGVACMVGVSCGVGGGSWPWITMGDGVGCCATCTLSPLPLSPGVLFCVSLLCVVLFSRRGDEPV